MLEEDIDDTHLCIKCSITIVGLENYVQHRKSNCTGKPGNSISRGITNVDHPYGTYDFSDPNTGYHHKNEVEVEKTTKSLSESYDLPYDLGADVFFSSLELQSSSKRTTVPTATSSSTSSGGGKHHHHSTTPTTRILTRKATAALLSNHDDAWISPTNNSDCLMKAVHDISGNKKCDSVFKLLSFQHDSPELTEDEDDDDDEYEVVPSTHTGGKWKPQDNNTSPSVIRQHTLLRNSPAWDDRHQWDIGDGGDEKSSSNKMHDNEEFEHDLNPPPSHTKGKWVPGTKIIKLDYKEDVEIEKIFSDQYWCNTCNRKLASKLLYERHLKSNLHSKRSKPEQELEQATSGNMEMITFSERIKRPSRYLNPAIYLTQKSEQIEEKIEEKISKKSKITISDQTKRKRRKHFIQCDTCKTRLPKYLLGKHLISHYHYRRMILNPAKSFDLVLENMQKIVHQSPYQCQPCRFYTNTENDFINHWNSRDHGDIIEGPGRFFCNFCKFECEDNNQMRRHLLGSEHKEVVRAINRSVPIIIGKKTIIECMKCKQQFSYNIELRKHGKHCTNEPIGTASNDYQSKFICEKCGVTCKSRLSLQKHQLLKHKDKKYFCTACKINFETSQDAKKHRTTIKHKITTGYLKKENNTLLKKCKICKETLQDLLKLKEHLRIKHPEEKYSCPHCGENFILSQEVGRHVRDKICQPSTSKGKYDNDDAEQQRTSSTTESPFLTSTSSSTGCGTIIKNHNSSKIKQKSKESSKSWKCTSCEYTTNLRAEFLYHEILHTISSNTNGQMKIPCSICGKLFRKHSLRCHLRQHTNERIFSCNECPMRFSRKHNLKTHIMNVHESKRNDESPQKRSNSTYQCDTCGKVFNKKYALKQHINIHNERDKKFRCPVESCIFIGRNSSDLKTHLTVHSSERKFECDFEGCNYRGKTITLLKRHSKKHQPTEKEYFCQNCDFKTRISGHLKRHIRVHTGEKPYKCPHCEYAANNSENLRKHVLTTTLHSGKFLYECKFCTNSITKFKTNFQKDYRAHLIIIHRLENDLSEYLTF